VTTASRGQLIALAASWHERRIETSTFIVEYWRLRDHLLESNPELFVGRFGELSSNIETATNIYSASPNEAYELGEADLRRELEPVVRELLELKAHR
jgi:hypothetical protein